MTQYKLGKLDPIEDPRTLKLAAYLNHAALPPIPVAQAWSERIGTSSWGMMGNDTAGDCGYAGPGHQIMGWTSYTQPTPFVPTTDQIIAAYAKGTGYDPRTGAHDNGTILLNMLKQWKADGIAGHTIDAFASVNPRDEAAIRAGLFLFGGLTIGLALPLAAQDQLAARRPWTVSSGRRARPGTWGGHCVWLCGFAPDGLTCITWGAIQKLTWEFLSVYCDELWAVISHDWLANGIVTPSGLDLPSLNADLAAIAA